MSRYRIIFDTPAQKQMRAILDRRVREPLERAILALADDPRPAGVRKMVGGEGEWRIRVGTWRVVYRVDDGVLVVLVVRVAPRGGVYR